MHPCKTITAVLPIIAILTFEVSSFLPKTPNNSKNSACSNHFYDLCLSPEFLLNSFDSNDNRSTNMIKCVLAFY